MKTLSSALRVLRKPAGRAVRSIRGSRWTPRAEMLAWTLAIFSLLPWIGTYAVSRYLETSAHTLIDAQPQGLWSNGQRQRFASLRSAITPPIQGVLRFHHADVSLPIFPGESSAALTLGAGHLRDSTPLDQRGNIVLSAHRDGPFRILKDIKPGDLLEIHTDSVARQFIVEETFIVEPEEVWVLERGDDSALTLITCYPFYFVGSAPQRFIVRAREAVTAVPAGMQTAAAQAPAR